MVDINKVSTLNPRKKWVSYVKCVLYSFETHFTLFTSKSSWDTKTFNKINASIALVGHHKKKLCRLYYNSLFKTVKCMKKLPKQLMFITSWKQTVQNIQWINFSENLKTFNFVSDVFFIIFDSCVNYNNLKCLNYYSKSVNWLKEIFCFDCTSAL